MYTQQCVKVSSANRGECVTKGGLYRHIHLCVAHFELHKKVWQMFSLLCGTVGGVRWSMFQEVGGLYGVSERDGVSWVQGSHSLGEKAVEQSGGAGSDAPEPFSGW